MININEIIGGEMKARYYSLILIFISLLFVLGCGGGGGGGDTVGVYDTVTLYASPKDTWSLFSDIATSVDSDGDSLLGCYDSPPDFVTNSFDTKWITIRSEIMSNLPSFVKPSKVRVDSVTITFTPMESSVPGGLSPPLPPVSQSLPGDYVDPGGTYDIEIPVISPALKTSSTLQAILCTGVEYRYEATFKFNGVEVLSGQEESFKVKIQVMIANYPE